MSFKNQSKGSKVAKGQNPSFKSKNKKVRLLLEITRLINDFMLFSYYVLG